METQPTARVELIRLGDDQVRAEAVCFLVQYEGKEAHLEIPVEEPRFEREPGTAVYRRMFRGLAKALQEVADSPEGIYWPGP